MQTRVFVFDIEGPDSAGAASLCVDSSLCCSSTDYKSTKCTPCKFNANDPREQYYNENEPHKDSSCKKAVLCSKNMDRIQGNSTYPARFVLFLVFVQHANEVEISPDRTFCAFSIYTHFLDESSRGKFVYCLANMLSLVYHTSRHVKTIVCNSVLANSKNFPRDCQCTEVLKTNQTREMPAFKWTYRVVMQCFMAA